MFVNYMFCCNWAVSMFLSEFPFILKMTPWSESLALAVNEIDICERDDFYIQNYLLQAEMGYISSPNSGIPYFDSATLISTIYVPIYILWLTSCGWNVLNAASIFQTENISLKTNSWRWNLKAFFQSLKFHKFAWGSIFASTVLFVLYFCAVWCTSALVHPCSVPVTCMEGCTLSVLGELVFLDCCFQVQFLPNQLLCFTQAINPFTKWNFISDLGLHASYNLLGPEALPALTTALDPLSAPGAISPSPVMLQQGWSPAPHSLSLLSRAHPQLCIPRELPDAQGWGCSCCPAAGWGGTCTGWQALPRWVSWGALTTPSVWPCRTHQPLWCLDNGNVY